jgi:DNA-binding NarL/FixJ family response regulator
MNSLKIIIADNNFNHAQKLKLLLQNQGFRQILTVFDANDLMPLIRLKDKHDLIILNHDLINLNLGNYFDSIKAKQIYARSTILFTNVYHPGIIHHFYNIGCDYVIHHTKLEFDLVNVIKLIFEKKLAYLGLDNIKYEQDLIIRDTIKKKLNALDLPIDLLGYGYLLTAIELVYQNRNLGYAATKKLYPIIGTIHQSNYQRVERAIRNTISKIKDQNCGYYKLSNIQFIFKVMNELG